ncbi:MAG: hypothetical protein K8R23_02030 [Chthoniobacter sp.]|nr:hypothetical protein [Chthoniobacter sp.]
MNQTNTPKENTTKSQRARRHYDSEFKKAAVEHCARHGGDLSGTVGVRINYWTLRDWVEAAWAAAAPPGTPQTASELEAEVRRLRDELARVTWQREAERDRLPQAARWVRAEARIKSSKKSLGILSTP